MTFSSIVLSLHNLNRYIIIVLAILVLYRVIRGWRGLESWSNKTRKLALFYMIALDTQLLIGMVLYFVTSEIAKAALVAMSSDFGQAMSVGFYRFFALEHPFYMVLSIVFAHIGFNTAKKEDMEDATKFKRMTIFIGLSVLAIALGHVGADMLSARWIP